MPLMFTPDAVRRGFSLWHKDLCNSSGGRCRGAEMPDRSFTSLARPNGLLGDVRVSLPLPCPDGHSARSCRKSAAVWSWHAISAPMPKQEGTFTALDPEIDVESGSKASQGEVYGRQSSDCYHTVDWSFTTYVTPQQGPKRFL